jgi:hypothetical protein
MCRRGGAQEAARSLRLKTGLIFILRVVQEQ